MWRHIVSNAPALYPLTQKNYFISKAEFLTKKNGEFLIESAMLLLSIFLTGEKFSLDWKFMITKSST